MDLRFSCACCVLAMRPPALGNPKPQPPPQQQRTNENKNSFRYTCVRIICHKIDVLESYAYNSSSPTSFVVCSMRIPFRSTNAFIYSNLLFRTFYALPLPSFFSLSPTHSLRCRSLRLTYFLRGERNLSRFTSWMVALIGRYKGATRQPFIPLIVIRHKMR